MRFWGMVIVVTACGPLALHHVEPPNISDVHDYPLVRPEEMLASSRWEFAFSNTCAKLKLAVPFLEGIEIEDPANAIPQTGYSQLTLAYPGPLSVPAIAWTCDGSKWMSVQNVDVRKPAILRLAGEGATTRISLECVGSCGLWQNENSDRSALFVTTRGKLMPFQDVRSLTARYRSIHFYVHDFIDAKGQKTDLSTNEIVAHLANEPGDVLSFVYGIDPGEVDLEGRYFAPPADQTLAAIRRGAPNAQLYHWLNLRTYKHAIPALGITRAIPPAIDDATKKYSNGRNDITQYSFEAIEMCLGAPEWQASRIRELERLLAAGFRVIAFDEFPTAPRWDGEPCHAANHLHKPNDAVSEFEITMKFVEQLAHRVRSKGAMVVTEEPNIALAPLIEGYMDGTHNDPPEMYDLFMKSSNIKRVPVFSTMIPELTPFTRPGAKTAASPPWLTMRKVTRTGLEPP